MKQECEITPQRLSVARSKKIPSACRYRHVSLILIACLQLPPQELNSDRVPGATATSASLLLC